MAENVFNEAQKTGEHQKCSSCGGEMHFSPTDGKLSCAYCGHQEEIANDNAEIVEIAFSAQQPKAAWDEKTTVMIHCSNCGANLVLDKNTASELCAFCGSPTMVGNLDTEAIVPAAVIPFKVDQAAANKAFKNWVKSRFFSPRDLRDQVQAQRLKGVYIPHFTYDCDTVSDYVAEAGTHYYETETYTVERDGKQVTETRQVQKTMWRPVAGTFSESFDDILVNASKNVDRKLINLEFTMEELVPYQKEYLFGFLAENNSISKEECWSSAQKKAKEQITSGITRQINADEVRGLIFHTVYNNVKFKEILLPVWISVYSYKGKSFKFMINGQTGQVKGQAPLSAFRIFMSILLTVVVPGLLCLINPIVGGIVFVVAVITLIVLANRKPK